MFFGMTDYGPIYDHAQKSDERILGSGEFVRQLIQQSDEERRKQFYGREKQEMAMDYKGANVKMRMSI